MRKFKSNNNKINKITFNGIKYCFIIDKQGVGIRREDENIPCDKEIETLTEYLFNEGWAEREDYEEREPWQDNA